MQQGKIELRKSDGPIVFIGSTNAMPMMYAIELKKLGYDVIYFVDRPSTDLLNRPENHFPSINYPYPEWIIEVNIPSQMMIPFFRKSLLKYLNFKLSKIRTEKPQLYILNSLFTSLASYINSNNCKVIALSHGGDLDSWADVQGADKLSINFSKHSFWKFLPSVFSKYMIKLAVKRQYLGYLKSEAVLYFPLGFNKNGDRVVENLQSSGVRYVPRFDISFEPLIEQPRVYKPESNKMVIFSGVRFTFKNFSEGNDGYNKGNDEIIKGISLFYKKHKNIEVHFVEKGLDYIEGKRLCKLYGIENIVTWHKEMKFIDLLNLYQKSDVCFDQVGEHWIGAIGAYALFLGKPLIANDTPHVKSGLWPSENPIFTSSNHMDVFKSLISLQSSIVRFETHKASKIFAEKYLGPSKVLHDLFEFESCE